jgi:hypothetical protein
VASLFLVRRDEMAAPVASLLIDAHGQGGASLLIDAHGKGGAYLLIDAHGQGGCGGARGGHDGRGRARARRVWRRLCSIPVA